MPSNDLLRMLQSYPLQLKIKKTKQRIREMIKDYDMYISYSGGKDSTVLKHLVDEVSDEIGINIPSVFVNTGLEYRSLRKHASEIADVIIKPEMSFREVLTKYGYPIISKVQSRYIEDVRNPNVTTKMKKLRMNGSEKGYFKISEKWKYLIDSDFRISNKCCYYMKKKPFGKYGKQTGKKPFIGTMAEESKLRKDKWLENGCNMLDGDKIQSMPLSFWTVQDILKFLYINNLEIPEVYGKIVKDGEMYRTTGVNRTGCVYCGYGSHNEPMNNRFVDLKKRDKQLFDYVIGGGKYDDEGMWIPSKEGLGFGHVLDVYGVNYTEEQLTFL